MEASIRDPKWFFPLSQSRKSSPSRQDGISFEQELVQQSKGVQFVTKMAVALRSPSQTIFAASLFLHRYYIRNSLKRVHPYQIASACVFLACKTEESPRKLKEVACIATKMALKLPSQKTPAEIEAEHKSDVEQWVRVIPTKEDELLQALKFDFEDTMPYDHLNKLVHSYVPPDFHQLLGSTATLFSNDSCSTMSSLTAPMPHLAAAALYWASKTTKTAIPDGPDHEKWYTQTIGRNEIVQIINDMAEMIPIVRAASKIDGQKYDKIS